MSRIGKMPVAIPAGVTVTTDNGVVTVKGPKGTLSQKITGAIDVKVEGGKLEVVTKDSLKETNAKHGLYRAVIASMVKGVTEGYQKALEIKGVGWKVTQQGNKIVLSVGFSHTIDVVEPEGIKFNCPTQTDIVVSGIDKVKVGQVAANIRSLREPEPYHGYGIRYKDEVVEHKEGKTSGGKGKK